MAVKNLLPNCGLYRTTKPLPEHESEFPAGSLVYFHNHSDSGLPVVIAPDHNIMNEWHFHGAGTPFRGLSWADSLVKMLEQGFYSLRKQLDFEGGTWPKGAIVQLGYNKVGDAILFIAQKRAQRGDNSLFFSDRGVPLARERLSLLEPLGIYVEPQGEGGHDTGTH
jgi:hypothetical protein